MTEGLRLWIAQYLCPQRHTIMAAAGVADSPADAQRYVRELRLQVDQLLEAGALNPWCGICHAPKEKWTVDLGRTVFSSLDEARESLHKTEAENIATGLAFGELGGTDKKGKPN